MFKFGVPRRIFGTERATEQVEEARNEGWDLRFSKLWLWRLLYCWVWRRVIWLIPAFLVLFNPEDGSFEYLWNVGAFLPNYTPRPSGHVKSTLRGFHDAILCHILLGYRKKQDTVSIHGGDEKWASLLFYFLKHQEKVPVHKSDAR
jgi:hypothetical protein